MAVDFENDGQIAGGDVNQNETDTAVDIADSFTVEYSFTVDDSFTQDNDVVDVDDSLNENETEVEL